MSESEVVAKEKAQKRRLKTRRESASFDEGHSAATLVEDVEPKDVETRTISVPFIDLAKVKSTTSTSVPKLRIMKKVRKSARSAKV